MVAIVLNVGAPSFKKSWIRPCLGQMTWKNGDGVHGASRLAADRDGWHTLLNYHSTALSAPSDLDMLEEEAFDISTFEVVTWSRDYVTTSFMWIFELTNDICITYFDIYLPRSCLFSLFGHFIWLWISELPKKTIWFIIVDNWPGKPM